jgi:hypothetical protein
MSIAVNPQGVVRLPAFDVPYSGLASEGARRNFIDVTAPGARNPVPPGTTGIDAMREALDDGRMRPMVERLRSIFPVTITPKRIAGIQTDVVEPTGGVSQKNRTRVLINLHGGGFAAAARYVRIAGDSSPSRARRSKSCVMCGQHLANGEPRPLSTEARALIRAENDRLADAAMRVLGMAFVENDGALP